ncbi:MAG: hypothetical protein GWP17_02805 [Aquificales bacterium]|nr:hypothetical protein [Aquificales bacterium]
MNLDMVTRSVKFRRILDENIALRVRFATTRGKIDGFVVQLESFINDKWHPIVRYDTAHGFAHQDVLHPFDDVKKSGLVSQNYNEALTYAIQDLSENWDFYDQRYKTWLR